MHAMCTFIIDAQSQVVPSARVRYSIPTQSDKSEFHGK